MNRLDRTERDQRPLAGADGPRSKHILRKTVIGAAILATSWLLIGTGLALSPAPKLIYPTRSPSKTSNQTLALPSCRDGVGMRCFPMRDGALLAARPLASDGDLLVVYLHGILGSAAQLEESARMLRESTGATVIPVDLRGHGLSAGPRGDVDHIGQWEEDVADVVSALRKERPGAKVILAGHSMGGGIAMRYAQRHAQRRDVPGVDGYLLFAPHLGESSPTAHKHKEPAVGAQGPAPIKVHLRRLIGLVMLNIVGVHGLNGLDTLYFDLPVDLPISAYTFRAMAGMAPEDYHAAVTADAAPLLVAVGQNDEAFRADAYPTVVGLHYNGRAVVVAGETHDGVLQSRAAMDAVREWIGVFRERV